jgi:hypothetical protein
MNENTKKIGILIRETIFLFHGNTGRIVVVRGKWGKLKAAFISRG